MDIDILKVIVTVIIAVLGWIIGHAFTNRRNKIQKRRDLTVQYLIEVYRVLTNEISHREETRERNEKLENILSDIQLFGSITQIELAKKLADDVAKGEEFQLDSLINSLREDLRAELKLDKIGGNVRWLRFNNTR